MATNLKTTADSNITKTQSIKNNIKNKTNTSFTKSKTIAFFSSSKGLKKNINSQIKKNRQLKKS